ncbi:J domain-containing protein required for chloroplast accumulation response, partial [Thalictrum thalictroides]
PPVKFTTETDSSAFPAQSHNLRKNKETAIIEFPSSPGASTSRFSIEVTQRQEGLKNELRSLSRQSSLSKHFSLKSEGLEQASKSVKHDSEDYCKEDSSTSKITYNSTQFHFSIYKWASAGVPIPMSLWEENKSSTIESSKSDDTVNQHAASSLQSVEHSSDNYDMLAENKSLRSPQKNQDDNSVLTTESVFVDSKITKEVISAKPEQKSLTNIQNIFKKVPGNLLSQNAKKDIKSGSDPSFVDVSSFKGSEKRIPVSKKEALESEEPLYCLLTDMKAGSGKRGADNSSVRDTEKQMPVSKTEISKPDSLYCLIKDDKHDLGASGGDKKIFGSNDKRIRNSKKETPKSEESLYCLLNDDCQGNDNAIDKANTKKGTASSIYTSASDVGKKKKVKKQSGKRNILSPTEENSSSLQDTPVDLEEKPVVNKAEGMVKKFVNTFNQNAPSKPVRNVAIREQGDIVTVVAADKAEDQQNIKSDQKNNVILTDSTAGRVDQSSKQFAKPHREIKTVEVLDCAFERNKSSASCAEPVIETIEIAVDNVEDTSEEFDCTVKELSQDQNKDPQVGQSHEEIQALDAKIRKWANGKEGNIRSLLSTLQYVLWPESGWKPVPLVDIIEGGSVRRSYQKALLCLHPDKLQQKGAAPHQKYIAEKVFDILQEAWEHFNVLGSF